MKKRARKKRIPSRKNKKLKTIYIYIASFVILLTILLSINFKPVETIEHENIKVAIESPMNQTYHTENIILKVVASNTTSYMGYSMDDKNSITECYNCNSYTLYYLKFNEGTHIIKAFAIDFENRTIESSVTFTVD